MPTVDSSSVAGFPLFARFAATELDDILSGARTVRFAKNSRVFVQGEEALSFFVLVDGYVRATKTTAGGEEIVVRYIAPGEMFGVAPAIEIDTYPATAVAAVDAVALSWPAASWKMLTATYPEIATHALRTIGARLQDAHTRIVELTTQEVEQRIARTVLRLAEQAGRPVDRGIEIEFPLRRQDIAQLTGTTMHSVSRVLSAWEQQKLIHSNNQRIVVCDSKSLSSIAGSRQSADTVPRSDI